MRNLISYIFSKQSPATQDFKAFITLREFLVQSYGFMVTTTNNELSTLRKACEAPCEHNFQRGFIPLIVLIVVAVTGSVVVGGSAVVTKLTHSSRIIIDVEQAIKASPNYLDKNKIRAAVIEGDVLGTVLLSDGQFSSYKVIDAKIADKRYQGEVRIAYLSGDYALGHFDQTTIAPFVLKDGTEDTAVIVDRVIAKLVLQNGQGIALKILEGEVRSGKLIGVFRAQTFASGHVIVGQLDGSGSLIAGSVNVGSDKASEAQTIIASEALGLYQKIAQSNGSRVLGVNNGIEVAGIEGGPVPLYDETRGTWSFGGAIVTPSTNLVSNLITYVQEAIPSQIESQLAAVGTGTTGATTIISGISEIKSASARLSVATSDNISTLSLDLSGITADISKDSVKTEHIKDGEVREGDIAGGAISEDKLAGTLSFDDGDFLDLSAIVHDDASRQGLRLPNVSSATPSNPTSGEGYIAYDTSGDQLLIYNGTSWTTVSGGESGDITAVNAGNGLSGGATSGDASLAVNLTTSGTTGSTSSNSGLEVSSSGLTLLKGCDDAQLLKWTDAGGWACAADSGGAGGDPITVQEGDVTVDATVTVFDFLAADFIVSEDPEDEVNISIDYTNSKIVRSDQTESISGGWTFANLTISDTNVPLTGASFTFDFNNALDRTLTITNSAAGVANLTVEGTITTQSGLSLNYANPKITINDGETFAITDGTNNLLTIADNGTTGTLSVNTISCASTSCITLGTETDGDYVASIANGTGISGGGAGSEGAALTLSVDQATAFAWTAAQSITGTVTNTGSLYDVNVTLGDDLDADTVNGVSIDVTSAATGDADTLYALNIGNVTNQAVVNEYAIRVGSGWQEVLDINGTLLSVTELGLLDGKTTLVDIDDAVNTAITGTGALGTGSITSGFGAIDIGTDALTAGVTAITTLTTTGTVDLSSDASADTITIGQSGTTDDTVTIAGDVSITDDQWSVTAAGVGNFVSGTVIGSQTFTTNNILDSGALTIKTTTTGALTLDSGTTGTVNLGTGNNAKTIAIGTGTAGNTINIGTDNTTLDTITIGSALDDVAITGDQWSVTNAGVLTVVSCTGCGGGGATLDSAYATGNTITTDSGSNVIITLQEVVTPTSFVIENQDTAGVSAERIFNSIATGTLTNGLLVEQTGAGTMTNAIQIAETAGTITDGILITGTLGNILNSGSIDITGAGAITGATGITSATGNVAITAGDLTLNGTTRLSNAGVGTFITGTVIGSQTFTTNNIVDSGALTIKTTTASALTLDSGTTGTVNLGTGSNAKTIAIGTGTAGNTINIGTDNTTLDTITIGSALDNVAITGDDWSITNAGVLTVQSCTGCGGGSQTPWTSDIDADNFSLLDLGTNITSRAGLTVASAANGAGASGAVTVNTGTGTTSTGALNINTGNASAGTAGNIVLDIGTSTSSNGSILIGTAARAQTITIGNSTGGVITIGQSTGSDLALNDAQWSVTGAGAAAFASVSEGGTGLSAKYAPIAANFVTVTANGTLTGETGIDALTTAISTTNTLNVDGASTLAALTLDAGSNFTMTSGTGLFAQTHAVTTDATADAMTVTLSAGGTGETGALRGLVISQSDTGTTGVYDSLASIINLKTPETTTNGLLIEQNAASGTLTNGLNVTSTAGTITSGLLIADGAGAITNGIQLTGTFTTTILDTPSLDISGAGAITGATGITTATGNVAITAGDLTLNGTTRISNAGVGTFITGTVIGSLTFTTNNIADSGALTISSGGTAALTLRSANNGSGASGNTFLSTGSGTSSTGLVSIFTGAASAGTAGDIFLNVGSSTSGSGTINLGNNGGGQNIRVGSVNTSANNVYLGFNGLIYDDIVSIAGDVSITDDQWSITGAGAANFASIGVTTRGTGAFTTLDANGAVTLGDAAADTITLNGQINTGITFIKEVARTIQIADSTTANTAGAALTIKGAAGLGTGAGGGLVYTAGAGGATGAGGTISLTTGAGGSTSGASGALTLATGTTTAGSTSTTGAITIQTGLGATGSSSAGGASGGLTLKTQAGGAGSGTDQNGASSGTLSITTGSGGAATGAGQGASAGGIELIAGNGGDGGGAKGTGGYVMIRSGAQGGSGGTGATISLPGPSAVGGAISLTGGNGASGFAGGALTYTGGAGSPTGTGGAINLTSGAGGSTSGDSGAIVIDSGTVTSGTKGSISIGTTNSPTISIGNSATTVTINSGTPATNGVAYSTDTSGALAYTATGGAGTLCLTSADGGTPAWGSCGAGGATAWDAIGDPAGAGAIAFASTEQTMDWDFTTTAHDGMTFNFDNNGGTAGTDNGVVINNAVSDAATGDLNTENLLLIQQLDTTTSGTTVVDNALKIDVAANSGMTDGIEITNSAGNLTNAINIADTAGGTITTGILMSGTFTNLIDAPNFDVDNAGNLDTGGALTAGSSNIAVTDATGHVQHDSIVDCADGQILKWATGGGEWGCAADATGGGGGFPTGRLTGNVTHSVNTTYATIFTIPLTINTTNVIYAVLAQSTNATTNGIQNRGRVTQSAHTGYCNYVRQSAAAANGNIDNIPVSTTPVDTASTAEFAVLAAPTTVWCTVVTNGTAGDLVLEFQPEVNGGAQVTHAGSFYTLAVGGADLAEIYYSNDYSIAPGDIVSLDPSLHAGVKKSNSSYDKNILGIVSTKPGLLLGDGSGGGMAVPVALSGRVPVNVSTENGPIRIGDLLTSSSTAGVAMKATKAGQIVGQAMTPFDGEGVGSVLAFIKTDYANGAKLEVKDSNTLQMSLGKLALAQFISQKEQLATAVDLSEIVTDRVAAGLEVITPKVIAEEVQVDRIAAATGSDVVLNLTSEGKFVVTRSTGSGQEDSIGEKVITFDAQGNANFAGTITADKVKANQIEGLEIFTDKLASLSEQVAGIATSSAQTIDDGQIEGSALKIEDGGLNEASPSSILDPQNSIIDFQSSSVNVLNLDVLGTLNAQGALVVAGPAEFKNETLFEKLVTFVSNVIFKGDVTFLGRPTFNKDTAGFAVIKKDADTVEIVFEKEYAQRPLVNISITLDDLASQGVPLQIQEELEQKILQGDIRYIVTRRTVKGFTIKLNKPAPDDLTFSWSALAVKDARTVVSSEFVVQSAEAGGITPTITPSLTPSSTATPTPEPTLSPAPVVTSNNNEPITNNSLTILDNELGFLRVREEASTGSHEVGKVLPGQTFEVLEESLSTSSGSSSWYKIEYETSKFGWVSGSYITVE